MKKILVILLFVLLFTGIVVANNNNDFYDDAKTYELKSGKIRVEGEIINPGIVDLKKFETHSLIVKETKLEKGEIKFIGSYRYIGYSLFDILKERNLNKKNKNEFKPVVDMLVIIENNKGERVVVSWGELYYPSNLHRIIIATKVIPILPKKIKLSWRIPKNSKLVFGNDFITERNIESPTKITVISAPINLKVNGKVKLFSEKISIIKKGDIMGKIESFNDFLSELIYPSVFYGMGRGFHGINTFKGIPLKTILMKYTGEISKELLRKGYLIVTAVDGYRIIISCGELFNRNDHNEFLLIELGRKTEGGRFKIYPAPDFFSDRAIKSIDKIIFRKI